MKDNGCKCKCNPAKCVRLDNAGYIAIPPDPHKEIAAEIRETISTFNRQIAAAEKLGLEVEIKQNHQCEVPTPKYRVEITQTVKF